ncbi:Uncharacterised protein [Mycobacterium tuberculosis]|nr:Uncharacterised protein [Mycobacterium tuberculosis]CNW94389.1 Uncharacterised protein [Mycobacterium tuberculosis]
MPARPATAKLCGLARPTLRAIHERVPVAVLARRRPCVPAGIPRAVRPPRRWSPGRAPVRGPLAASTGLPKPMHHRKFRYLAGVRPWPPESRAAPSRRLQDRAAGHLRTRAVHRLQVVAAHQAPHRQPKALAYQPMTTPRRCGPPGAARPPHGLGLRRGTRWHRRRGAGCRRTPVATRPGRRHRPKPGPPRCDVPRQPPRRPAGRAWGGKVPRLPNPNRWPRHRVLGASLGAGHSPSKRVAPDSTLWTARLRRNRGCAPRAGHRCTARGGR